MDKNYDKDVTVLASPVAEGVRFDVGSAAACAVRNRRRDITVRVWQERRLVRSFADRIPMVRGVVRLFGAVAGFFTGLNESIGYIIALPGTNRSLILSVGWRTPGIGTLFPSVAIE